VAFEELKERQSKAWGAAPFENISATAGDLYEGLVERLGPVSGERWLDVATGTGAIAIRAARGGAEVTGVDFAGSLVETARRTADEEGLSITFAVGDAEALSYPDASFDVVSSSFGVMFAPDQKRAAGELARVCRPGGRLGLMAWRPEGSIGEYFRLLSSFQPPPPEGAGVPVAWGREEHVQELLGDTFELEFHRETSVHEADSGEEVWELFSTSFGPLKVLAASLDPERREELHHTVAEFFEGYRDGDVVRQPREYLLVLGTRR